MEVLPMAASLGNAPALILVIIQLGQNGTSNLTVTRGSYIQNPPLTNQRGPNGIRIVGELSTLYPTLGSLWNREDLGHWVGKSASRATTTSRHAFRVLLPDTATAMLFSIEIDDTFDCSSSFAV